MTLQLRPYQQEAVDALFQWWEAQPGNPLIVLPTGTGKSLVLAEISKRCLAWPGVKILCVAHVRELIKQNASEIISLWPEAPVGINSAGVGRRDTAQGVIFCSIQSVYSKAHLFQKVDIVLIDEAHLIPSNSDTMYQRFLRDLQIINPYCKVVGLTATPYRLDSGRLDQGKGKIFDGVCYEYNVRDAIEQSYLSRPVTRRTDFALDTDGVGTRGGEFIAGDLERAVDTDAANEAAVEETIRRAEGRSSWLFFCAGVAHARHVRDMVRARGFTCETLHAKTPKTERDRILEDFKAQKITALASCNILTTGFNAKCVDLIALLRPTKSAGLYVQMVGRGTRLFPGKTDCLVLDYAGNIARFGPIDDIRLKEPGAGGGPAPFKYCPDCETACPASASLCPCCGHEFPPPEKPLVAPLPSALPLLSSEKPREPEWVEVTGVSYRIHQKPDKPPSLQVNYSCGLLDHRAWWCFEHGGYAAGKAAQAWISAGGAKPWPRTTEEAFTRVGELATPKEIRVKQNGKFTEIVGVRGVSNLRPPLGARLRPHASNDARA